MDIKLSITAESVRTLVKRMRTTVGADVLPNAKAYEVVAHNFGFPNWDTLSGMLKQSETAATPPESPMASALRSFEGLGNREARQGVVDQLQARGMLPAEVLEPRKPWGRDEPRFLLSEPFDLFVDLRTRDNDTFEESWAQIRVDQAFINELQQMRTEYNRDNCRLHTHARPTTFVSHRSSTRYTGDYPDGLPVVLVNQQLIADGVNWWVHADVQPSEVQVFSRAVNVEWFLKAICDGSREQGAIAGEDKQLWTDQGLVMLTHPGGYHSLSDFVEALVDAEKLSKSALDLIDG